MKKILIVFLMQCGFTYSFAQKGTNSISINAGTAIDLTNSSYTKPGFHLSSYFSSGVGNKKDAFTFGVGFSSFSYKALSTSTFKVISLKIGYRFFPAPTVPVYVHPVFGLAFVNDGFTNSTKGMVGIGLGYLPKVGKGKLNVFVDYNKIGLTDGFGLLEIGAGYEFGTKRKK